MPGRGTPRVLVSGAGIGGLTVAHGLRRAGWDVVVYERDASPAVRGQGYRLSIDAVGAAALRECLPSANYEFIRQTARGISAGGGFSFLDHNAKALFSFYAPPSATAAAAYTEGSTTRALGQVDRAVLRHGLLAGLHDCVNFGTTIQAVQEVPGRVVAVLSDGSAQEADIVVS